MQSKLAWALLGVATLIIIVLGALLVATPSPSETGKNQTPSPVPAPFTSENVKVTWPLPGTFAGKNFTVRGEAKGSWYFEASFPVQVRDPQGKILASTHAEAQSDWMTTDRVPFKAEVSIESYTGPATLILLKDNPSGLPENEDSVEFQITIQ